MFLNVEKKNERESLSSIKWEQWDAPAERRQLTHHSFLQVVHTVAARLHSGERLCTHRLTTGGNTYCNTVISTEVSTFWLIC